MISCPVCDESFEAPGGPVVRCPTRGLRASRKEVDMSIAGLTLFFVAAFLVGAPRGRRATSALSLM